MAVLKLLDKPFTSFHIELNQQPIVTSTASEPPWFSYSVGPLKVLQGPVSFFAAHVQPLGSDASLALHICLPHAKPFRFSISVIELESFFFASECLTNHHVILLDFFYADMVIIHFVQLEFGNLGIEGDSSCRLDDLLSTAAPTTAGRVQGQRWRRVQRRGERVCKADRGAATHSRSVSSRRRRQGRTATAAAAAHRADGARPRICFFSVCSFSRVMDRTFFNYPLIIVSLAEKPKQYYCSTVQVS